jgi:hypothetical protein
MARNAYGYPCVSSFGSAPGGPDAGKVHVPEPQAARPDLDALVELVEPVIGDWVDHTDIVQTIDELLTQVRRRLLAGEAVTLPGIGRVVVVWGEEGPDLVLRREVAP